MNTQIGCVWIDPDGDFFGKPCDPLNQRAKWRRLDARGRQFGEAGVIAHKSTQAIGPGFDHFEAFKHVGPVFPVQTRAVGEQAAQAVGDRFDRCHRVVEFVSKDADEALPGLQLFLPQITPHIDQNEECMWFSIFAKGASPHEETSGTSGERAPNYRVAFHFKGEAESQLRCIFSQNRLTLAVIEEGGGGAIAQVQATSGVEGEDGRVDFIDHLFKQGVGLDRDETVFAQHLPQKIDFEHYLTEGIVGVDIARLKTEIPFPHPAQHVGCCLKGTDDARLERQGKVKPPASGQDDDRDPNFGGKFSEPKQKQAAD